MRSAKNGGGMRPHSHAEGDMLVDYAQTLLYVSTPICTTRHQDTKDRDTPIGSVT